MTGTPKVTWLIRHLVAEAKANPARYRLARASTYRNAPNLPTILLDELTRAYAHTRLGRQELYGELLEEAEGALWTLSDVDDWRAIDPGERTSMTPPGWRDIPDPRDLRISVGVDPAVTNTADSDETGIVVVGAERGRWPHGYVLADLSGRMSMETWGRRVYDACIAYGTTRVVAEANQGGDLVVSNINTARRDGDPRLHVEKAHAKQGKALRAGPVATLYEQHRIHHYGTLGDLESQMVTWVPGEELPGQGSPDRVDALVYAVLDLMDVPLVGGSLTQFGGGSLKILPPRARQIADGGIWCAYPGGRGPRRRKPEGVEGPTGQPRSTLQATTTKPGRAIGPKGSPSTHQPSEDPAEGEPQPGSLGPAPPPSGPSARERGLQWLQNPQPRPSAASGRRAGAPPRS